MAAPPPLWQDWNFALRADPGAATRGPAKALGALLWAHGRAGDQDQRGLKLPPVVRAFAPAGYDLFRFDRSPYVDDTNRAAGWMRDCLRRLRALGYRRIIVAGQSRGGWNALQMLDSPRLADVVLAFSPAAQGDGASLEFSAQLDELRRIIENAPPQPARLMVAQFDGDLFDADPAARARLLEAFRGRLGALLLINRPAGFAGHAAAYAPAFAARYQACLLDFAAGRAATC